MKIFINYVNNDGIIQYFLLFTSCALSLAHLRMKNKIDVSQYILQQLRKKVQPFFIRNKLARRQNFFSTPDQASSPKKQRKEKFRMSEGVEDPSKQHHQLTKKNQGHNKNKTLCLEDYHCRKQTEKLYNNMTQRQRRYHNLQDKVEKYLSGQKKRLHDNQKNGRGSIQDDDKTDNEGRYHKKIVSHCSSGFDFSKIESEVKKNAKNMSQQQLDNKLHFLNIVSLETSPQKKKSIINKGREKQNKQKSQKNDHGILWKQGNRQGNRKKTKLRTQLVRRSSLMMACLNNEICDNVDQQFEEGLVEQIYTAKRLKFRKKMNQERSKKNIYDGSMYFLKD